MPVPFESSTSREILTRCSLHGVDQDFLRFCLRQKIDHSLEIVAARFVTMIQTAVFETR
jgi:hypothetical protein